MVWNKFRMNAFLVHAFGGNDPIVVRTNSRDDLLDWARNNWRDVLRWARDIETLDSVEWDGQKLVFWTENSTQWDTVLVEEIITDEYIAL